MLNTLFEQLHTKGQAVERLDKTVESWLKKTTATDSSRSRKSDFVTFLKQVGLKNSQTQEGQNFLNLSTEKMPDASVSLLEEQVLSSEPVLVIPELLTNTLELTDVSPVFTEQVAKGNQVGVLDPEMTEIEPPLLDEQFINRLVALLTQIAPVVQDSQVVDKSTHPQLQDVLEHVKKLNFAELKSPEKLTQLFQVLQENLSQNSNQQIKPSQLSVFDPFQFETKTRSDKSVLVQGNPLHNVAKTLFKVLSEKLPPHILTELKANLTNLKLILGPEVLLPEVNQVSHNIVSIQPQKLPLPRTVQEHQVLSELQKPVISVVEEARKENEFLRASFTTLPEIQQITQSAVPVELPLTESSVLGVLSSSKLVMPQIGLDSTLLVKSSDATSMLPTSVQSQAVDAVRQVMQAARHELVMTLEPEHLGSMRVNISQQTIAGIEKITAKIFVESTEARQDLESKLSQFEDRLTRQGLNISKIEIIQANEKSQSQFLKEHSGEFRQNESQQNNTFASFQSGQHSASQEHRNAFTQRNSSATYFKQEDAFLSGDFEQVTAVSSTLDSTHDGQVNLSV